MAISAAERNRRKRERKKREKEQKKQRQLEDEDLKKETQIQSSASSNTTSTSTTTTTNPPADVEIEYVEEELGIPAAPSDSNQGEKDGKSEENDIESVMKRFQMRSSVATISDDEGDTEEKQPANPLLLSSNTDRDSDSDDDDDDDHPKISKRKMKELTRPTVAQLKTQVKRADLVEAHDVTAADPHFLIYLKGTHGTVPVPRHWGRKRKYLQGKRGIEKMPFKLPDFIVKTGICEMRNAMDEDEKNKSEKQKNRARVAPKLGAVDVDYQTLHGAFFKYQTKPNLTKFGDLYYEGREFETQKSSDLQPGVISDRLREALGMANEGSPPPWLFNMQRHGPPPSYPNLKIPGLNAPIPDGCNYGYHINGWGKPPLDQFGRPLYGGDPFSKFIKSEDGDTLAIDGGASGSALVTSDGKTLSKEFWGALPSGNDIDEESSSSEEEDEDSDDEDMMEESDAEDEADPTAMKDHSSMPPPPPPPPLDGVESVVPDASVELRKNTAGLETPVPPKKLYTVLETKEANKDQQSGAVFTSENTYVLPGSSSSSTVPDGAESVLSKSVADNNGKRKKRNISSNDDEEVDTLGKKFKF